VAGWGIYAAVYAGFAFAKSPVQVWMLFGIYGLFFGLTEGVERALVADFAPGVLRGSVFGLYHLISGVASLFASLIFGLLWKWGGDPLSFLVGAGLALWPEYGSIARLLCTLADRRRQRTFGFESHSLRQNGFR
jgi:MFS family permease